jgi:hypothetical protein
MESCWSEGCIGRGQAEVNIITIRVQAGSTKAGVRDKYGYLPPYQSNMDLCFDCVQVMNRLPKSGQEKSPCEIFTGKGIDYLRDFRVSNSMLLPAMLLMPVFWLAQKLSRSFTKSESTK